MSKRFPAMAVLGHSAGLNPTRGRAEISCKEKLPAAEVPEGASRARISSFEIRLSIEFHVENVHQEPYGVHFQARKEVLHCESLWSVLRSPRTTDH